MIAVIGCGNRNRSDDGAGPAVVSALLARGHQGRGVKLLDAGTDGMAVMFAARGCRTLILVDACRSGSPPGAIFEIPGDELEAPHEPSLNLHDFRWDHALYAGRRILRDEFPSDVTALLIEAGTVDFGVGLSAKVAAATEKVADRIEAIIATRLAAASS
jgi:hydrogenase maturation protease